MNIPAPQTPQRDAWVPPTSSYVEIKDVDMAEVSPPQKPTPPAESDEEERNGKRVIALSGLKRVYKSRKKQRERSRLAMERAKVEDVGDSGDESEDGVASPVTQNTSNHYTLNLPGPASPQSDTPYVLLG